jgi:cyclopropane-fatty-acyl-phospholipid synthase
MLWSVLLNYLVKSGDLNVIDASGKTHRFGISGQKPKSAIRLHDSSLHHKLFFNPEFHLGESYMNGTLTIEVGDLNDFLTLLATNFAVSKPTIPEIIAEKFAPLLQKIQQYNPVGIAQKNVAPHYDISDQLYELFLDNDMHYSCAYFTNSETSLEQAQQDKVRHIAAKLCLKPGMKVLDIGSGWGGLAMYLARTAGVDVTGVTLSGKQARKATQRVKEAGLENQVHFLQTDYRDLTGTFDRIVSVGMMEHVGVGFYPQLFEKTKALLNDDGIAFFHCIGRLDGPGTTNPWLRKYIFPGGYAPALSEVTKVVEKSGLLMTDIEILRLHYAYTLHEWLKRFRTHWKEAVALYDERFCRMFEFYLVSCEMDFRYLSTMVFQMQLSKSIDAVPLTRDYMVEWEQAHPSRIASQHARDKIKLPA